jgi:hypothetical protein
VDQGDRTRRPVRLLLLDVHGRFHHEQDDQVRYLTPPEHFQAKRIPVRVKKMRKNKNLEHFHVSMKRENALGMASPGILSGRLAGRSLFS